MTREKAMGLSDEELRVKMAELDRWSNLSSDGKFGHKEELTGSTRGSTPDYPHDLDAVAILRKRVLTTEEAQRNFIAELVNRLATHDAYPLIDASAREQCEVLAIGLIP